MKRFNWREFDLLVFIGLCALVLFAIVLAVFYLVIDLARLRSPASGYRTEGP